MHKSYNKYEIYGFWGLLNLIYFLLRTKLFYSKSRLIRFPFELRGKSFINLGTNLTTGVGCRFEAYPYFDKKIIIEFGDNIEINDYVHIAGISSILIGDNVLIASKVFISDIQHGSYNDDYTQDNPNTAPGDRELRSKNIIIEDNVWIGESASILSGVIVGRGSIIGANSVVSKSIPPYSIAVGVPAKVIKVYNFESKKWENI